MANDRLEFPNITSLPELAPSHKCPCHGSVYDVLGNVLGGPAPKGLNWFEVSLSPTGKLLVDASKTVKAGTKFAV
ncbi:MAG: Rieske 2Fe-2S domain-containing protein [Nitrospirae bacterium]|nr:Rieske 2Fe-2S domain-containing protein [Nitrospirota bacterium]